MSLQLMAYDPPGSEPLCPSRPQKPLLSFSPFRFGILTVKVGCSPSQGPIPILVSLVQDVNPPQTLNVQPPILGSNPSRASARELFPAPVGPTMTTGDQGSFLELHKSSKL